MFQYVLIVANLHKNKSFGYGDEHWGDLASKGCGLAESPRLQFVVILRVIIVHFE